MRLPALCLFVSLCLAQNTPSEEEIWKQFSDWLAKAAPSDSPRELQASYLSHLQSAGVPQEEAERRRTVLFRQMRTRPDAWRVIFNGVYRNPNATFSTRPNALLIAAVEGLQTGRALDAGMGQGRNSVFLALKGWQVTGFDVSD
jgi:2-polyprenyl-3-methyl-5-hydroxy-6-metoxy-1,4-benzoquinol methylase